VLAIGASKVQCHILCGLCEGIDEARHICSGAVDALLIGITLRSRVARKLSKQTLLLWSRRLATTAGVHNVDDNIVIMVLDSTAASTAVQHPPFFVALGVEKIVAVTAEKHLCFMGLRALLVGQRDGHDVNIYRLTSCVTEKKMLTALVVAGSALVTLSDGVV
jgi:hypothetical protein